MLTITGDLLDIPWYPALLFVTELQIDFQLVECYPILLGFLPSHCHKTISIHL